MIASIFKSPRRTLLLFFAGSIICGIFTGLFIGFTRDLPQIRALETFSHSAVTRVYSADRILLAELYHEKRLISNAEIELYGSNLMLKKISLIKVEDISSEKVLSQLIPIIALSYETINEIINLTQKYAIKTVWESLNNLILNGKNILCYRIDREYNFYDIDSADDLNILKKKRKGQ